MPYFFALATVSVFMLTCAIATVATLTVATWRYLFPLIWRVWVWGIVGFAAAHALIIFLMMLLVPVGVGIAGGPPSHTDSRTNFLGALVLYGPMLASIVGPLVGTLCGWYLARRASVSRAANQRLERP
jgi:hypothetical protein